MLLLWVALPLLGAAVVAPLGVHGVRGSLHCAERRDISPCTCSPMMRSNIVVQCERMTSFGQVVTALRGRFQPGVNIDLSVSFSQLDDFHERSFDELGLSVYKLTLKGNNLSQLPEGAFSGLNGTSFLSLADNVLPTIPTSVLAHMPKVRSLDLSSSKLIAVRSQDFKVLPTLEHLILVGNSLSILEKDAFPRTLKHIHLGRNQIRHLNGTLRELENLEWLFLNVNQLTSLDGQLPENGMAQLQLVLIANNRLERLPEELRKCPRLETMYATNNSLTNLHGVFSRSRKLQLLDLTHNKIKSLAEDEFLEAENIEQLSLGFNEIESLNSSLQRIRALTFLNLTANRMTVFSLQEIHGLQRLKMVDLSYNRIGRLVGRMENVVDSETRVEELRLEYNALVSLDGALGGVQGLERLNLSHNLLASISPDDLIGLDQLTALDISYNRLHTLEETSKTFMPALEELVASHNLLQSLERDFHGLPALCRADLSNNNISHIHPELTTKTRCKVHGVNSVLRIALHNNPVRCDEQLARTLIVFQTNLTELQGVPPCTLALPQLVLVSVGAMPLSGVSGVSGVAVPVQVPVLPALYSGVPGVVGVAAQAPALVLGGYPLAPLAALPPSTTTTTTTTSTTTSTTTTTPPPPPTPIPETAATEAETMVETTELAATTSTASSTTTTPTPEPEPPAPGSKPEPEPEPKPELKPEPEPEPEAAAVPVPVAMPVPDQAVPVKELPPVIQLLQPEVSVQPSKDLPPLDDPTWTMVLARPVPPVPPMDAVAPLVRPAPTPPPPVVPAATSTPSTATSTATSTAPPPEAPASPAAPEEAPESPPVASMADEDTAAAAGTGPDSGAGSGPGEVAVADVDTLSNAAPQDSSDPAPPPPPPPLQVLQQILQEPMAADGPPPVSELPPLILIKLLNETESSHPMSVSRPLQAESVNDPED